MPKKTTLTGDELLAAIYEESQQTTKQVAALMGSMTTMQTDMATVKEQVKYTNGKVAGLMEEQIRRDEREKVLASQPPPMQTTVIAKTATVSKLDQEAINRALLGFGILASAIAGLIYWFVNGAGN